MPEMVLALGTHLKLSSTELALKVIAQHEAEIDIGLEPLASSVESRENKLIHVEPITRPRIEITSNPHSVNNDIASDFFMTDLKNWILTTSREVASAAQGKAMTFALTSGTLKVCDPVEGVVVTAWDIAGGRPRTTKRDEITPAGWSNFLKQHVKRDDGGYAKDADGGYMDVVSGESAYFGAVGSKFYYMTWPRADANI